MDKNGFQKNIDNIIEDAYEYFKNENYIDALELYEKIYEEIGEVFADYYIRACKQHIIDHFIQKPIKYCIVSACYNVAEYLTDFFVSITTQSLGFEENIQCVMVDDGSTDEKTAEIIKLWQKKYPKNILYIYKENSGQASARNFGLQFVKASWVTFTDPDDFLDQKYFEIIDKFILKNKEKPLCMVSTNIIFYHEEDKKFSDTHPLKFKFKEQEKVCKVSEINDNIQLSSASALFSCFLITKSKYLFDEIIRPNFEDGYFINRYLLLYNDFYISYLQSAKYFYRKRVSSNSSLDLSWNDRRRYIDVLKYGYIKLLQYNKQQYKFITNTVIYELYWYTKYFVNHNDRIDILSPSKKEKFLFYFHKCWNYIPVENILSFSRAGMWFYHKVGMCNCFKNIDIQDLYSQIVYIEKYDVMKDELYIRYFAGQIKFESFKINDSDTIPNYTKTQKDIFFDRTFVLVRHIWIPLEQKTGRLTVFINKKQARITFTGKQHYEIDIDCIRKVYIKQYGYKDEKIFEYNAPWVFMDKDTQADDNAEHLYRYIKTHYPEKRRSIYFVLRRESKDWKRLKEEEFQLLAYGTPAHEMILRQCVKIISSHIDKYVENYFGDYSTSGKQIIWLQHGVTLHDISLWINQKDINLLITSTESEYLSITRNYGQYKFTDKEVKLLGFPRHDCLSEPCQPQKSVIIMPTWRDYIVGKQIDGNLREKNPKFMQTVYVQCWSRFLNSPSLQQLSEKYGYKVIFCPHPNIQIYVNDFIIPQYISIHHYGEGTIQEIFKQAAVMITDYSSVAFEMAYLYKPVIYYQFDEEELFKNHLAKKGYFNYRQDGFGPVVTDQGALLEALEKILKHNGKSQEIYLSRMKKNFPVRDRKNCERVYRAILELDQPNPEGYINITVLREYVKMAILYDEWSIAEERLNKLLALGDDNAVLDMKNLCTFCRLVQNGNKIQAGQLYTILPEFTDPELECKKIDTRSSMFH